MIVFADYPVIESVEPNSPAERAGLTSGDTILAMNSQDLRRSPLPMASLIQPGRKVVFRYKRNGVREATVTVAPRPEGTEQTFVLTLTPCGGGEAMGMPCVTSAPRRDRATTEVSTMRGMMPEPLLPVMQMGFPRSRAVAGAELTALDEGLRALLGLNRGVFVVNVGAGTIASESGLRQADVILRAAGVAVANPVDFMKLLSEARKRSMELQIVRMKKPQTITLRW
jgi:S1-C subfamily serine protease